MSRMEPDQYINDRYQAIEDRLKVGCCLPPLPRPPALLLPGASSRPHLSHRIVTPRAGCVVLPSGRAPPAEPAPDLCREGADPQQLRR